MKPGEHKKWHFGVLSSTGTGHLNPLISLSQELQRRGYEVTFFDKPKIEDRVRQAGLRFFPIATNGHSPKVQELPLNGPGFWSEISALRFNLKRLIRDVETFLQETPRALRQSGVNALLIDEIALTGPTVAQLLSLPYVLISTSVPHNFGWNSFPWFSGYRYANSSFSWMQDMFLELSTHRLHGPVRRALNQYRRTAGLGPARGIHKEFPRLAQLTQLPQCLDLPRTKLPSNFYYTGPFVSRTARPSIGFPWNRLDGRPIIYASLGTTRNVQPKVIRIIAEGCQNLDLQLVISLGGRFEPELFADLPGKPVVVRYAPQLELLRIAKIVITHGGSNTAFEALMEGKPMIAIPLAHDQPAVAARLARLKIAVVLPVMRLSARRIRRAVMKVLEDQTYRDAAVKMQSVVQSIRGSERAADIIEEALDRHSADDRREPERKFCSADRNAFAATL
ncbi:MAG: glycosyltransferase [Candidatus Sulfotelmatobacter sp.]